MDKLIAAFPQNITDALETATSLDFKKPTKEIRNIVIVGMGGSGIGAKIVAQWIQNEINIPVLIYQEYSIPKFVSEHTLFIASSYSGNTEETISSIEEAKNQGAYIIGITSGGTLQQFCTSNGYDCVLVPGGNPPRTTTAFSITHLLNIFFKLGFIGESKLTELKGAKDLLDSQSEYIKSEAQKLAKSIHNSTTAFYATSEYDPLLVRARQQFNENSKVLCLNQVIPEMNHNELVGWEGGNTGYYSAVFFDTKDMTDQNRRRFGITIDIVKTKTPNVFIFDALGENQIEKTIYLIHLVDWASLYLADLRKVDPMDIKSIDYLKSELIKLV